MKKSKENKSIDSRGKLLFSPNESERSGYAKISRVEFRCSFSVYIYIYIYETAGKNHYKLIYK